MCKCISLRLNKVVVVVTLSCSFSIENARKTLSNRLLWLVCFVFSI